MAFDKTADRRSHDYITLFADLERARLLFATAGRTPTPWPRSPPIWPRTAAPSDRRRGLHRHEPSLYQGTADNVPSAAVTFDKFHVLRIINEAVFRVRSAEQKAQAALGSTRYIWLRNPAPSPTSNALPCKALARTV